MNRNIVFSVLSLVAVCIYMYIGIYTFGQNKKSKIHKSFLCLCVSYSIWSFAYAFAYIAVTKYAFSFWNKVAAIGWCSVAAITLYLVLLITQSKIVEKTIIKLLIFSPAILLFYMVVFLFGVDIKTPQIVSKIFYIGDFLYDSIFFLLSMITLFVWGIKSDNIRIKKQAKILVLSGLIPFILNLLTQTIFPAIGIKGFVLMGQLYAVIMILGTYLVITKYKFLILPEKFISNEIQNVITDMVLILDENHEIVRVSENSLEILGFKKDDLLRKKIDFILDDADKGKIKIEELNEDKKKCSDISLLKSNGDKIPVSLSCIKIYDKKLRDFLGTIIVIQDMSVINELKIKNKELQEKSIRDGLTKLYNHQYSVELIKKEVNSIIAKDNDKTLSLIMLDIDYFKKVNDTYGHVFGDYVLEMVSKILINNVGNYGHVGRFGGEEFIIILPEADLDKAYGIGENIRKEVENFKFDKGLKLTISIGIKQLKGETPLELVKATDKLLYKAKQNGRNRVEYMYLSL